MRKLPHELVAAFRATLEELTEAAVLLHVVDASHPAMAEHMAAVDALLTELEVDDRPTLLVLNKLDRLEERRPVESLLGTRGGVAISAVTGEGLDHLRGAIDSALGAPGPAVKLRIPHADGAALALCYARGRVLTRIDDDDHAQLEVELPPSVAPALVDYRG